MADIKQTLRTHWRQLKNLTNYLFISRETLNSFLSRSLGIEIQGDPTSVNDKHDLTKAILKACDQSDRQRTLELTLGRIFSAQDPIQKFVDFRHKFMRPENTSLQKLVQLNIPLIEEAHRTFRHNEFEDMFRALNRVFVDLE